MESPSCSKQQQQTAAAATTATATKTTTNTSMIIPASNTQSMDGEQLIMSADRGETDLIAPSSSSSPLDQKKNQALSKHNNGKDKPKKRGRDKKPPGHPKRPLSAYNFFFQLARDRLVAGVTEMIFTQEEIDTARAGPAIDPKKRLHRKTHGKVGFKELAFRVGALWKTLDPKYKDMFNKRANVEREKYEVALKHWKRTRYQPKEGGQSSQEQPLTSCSEKSVSTASREARQGSVYDADSLSVNESLGSNDFWDSMVAAVHDTIPEGDEAFNDLLNPEDDGLGNLLAMTRNMFDGPQQRPFSCSTSTRALNQGDDSLYNLLARHTQESGSSHVFRESETSILDILEPRPIAPSSLANSNGDCLFGDLEQARPQPELQSYFNSCASAMEMPPQPILPSPEFFDLISAPPHHHHRQHSSSSSSSPNHAVAAYPQQGLVNSLPHRNFRPQERQQGLPAQSGFAQNMNSMSQQPNQVCYNPVFQQHNFY